MNSTSVVIVDKLSKFRSHLLNLFGLIIFIMAYILISVGLRYFLRTSSEEKPVETIVVILIILIAIQRHMSKQDFFTNRFIFEFQEYNGIAIEKERVIRSSDDGYTVNMDNLDLKNVEFQERDGYYIEELNLRGNKLREIPDSMNNLVSLKKLVLANNHLEGNVLYVSPLAFHKMSKLEVLDLMHNSLSKIPGSIEGLTNLRQLLIGHNPLTSLPKNINRLEKLELLDLRGIDAQLLSNSSDIVIESLIAKGCNIIWE